MQRHSLISHRQLITSLVESSSTSTTLPIKDVETAGSGNEPYPGRPWPPEFSDRRQALLTLHTIFPTVLLSALDLLDRGLVSRLIVSTSQLEREPIIDPSSHLPTVATPPACGGGDNEELDSIMASGTLFPTATCGLEKTSEHIYTYVVESAASTVARWGRGIFQCSKQYIVHLDAWNCTCAGFASESYPSPVKATRGKSQQKDFCAWPFGGFGLEGNENVPCCKHLLACLLAERWKGILGYHPMSRHVSVDEVAAIIADI